ncbi:MAG: molybdate ABC transporter permease subunit [Gammaproteobacteria bacterium]|nr:molybdate ABC transporter permease subunit [Gammaproteobacteria bacterium]
MLLPDLGPLLLTVKLAFISTSVLIVIGTPVAWWLATTRCRIKPFAEAIVALPIVLPPTVMGFYLLILFSPQGALGSFWYELSGQALTFNFFGLVVASVLYSLPFVVQPLQSAFESVGKDLMEAAYTLGAKPLDAFFSVAVPLAKRGYLTAIVLGFSHTLGEFGVVLMIGGNIPGETRLISIAIYDHVESLEYAQAHTLSLILLAFAFVSMLLMYLINQRSKA